jgi:hypothetical protein
VDAGGGVAPTDVDGDAGMIVATESRGRAVVAAEVSGAEVVAASSPLQAATRMRQHAANVSGRRFTAGRVSTASSSEAAMVVRVFVSRAGS